MNNLFVLIDSSTKRSSKTSKYGVSTVAWAAWWNKIKGMPIRAEIIYVNYEGPNKIFYDGVIRALESCFHLCHKEDSLIIYGDCLPVINHIRAKRHRGIELRPFYKQVKYLESKFRCPINYHYMSESDPMYKFIDKLSKESREFFVKRLRRL